MEQNNTEHQFVQGSHIMEILGSASMGIYRIILEVGEHPRMTASDTMLELMGVDKNTSLTGTEIYDFWHSRIYPEDLKTVQKLVQDMINTTSRNEATYRWMHPTLGMRYVRCGGIGYKQDNGTAVLEGYHYDVTEQLAEERRKAVVVNALANLYVCMLYIDVNNDTYLSYQTNLLEVDRFIPKVGSLSNALQIFIDYLSIPEEKEEVSEFLNLDNIKKRLQYTNSISMKFRGTVLKWVQVMFIVSGRNPDGTVSHMVATIKDISEAKAREATRQEELKASINANRSKTMMLQNMTHEIRTPLNAMFGFSQLLSMPDGSISEDQKAEYFNYIYNSFNMLSMLIDDVMDLTDAEHGNYRIEKHPFSLNEACRNALQMAEMRLRAGVKMYFTSDVKDGFMLDSDGRRIQQLLVNYLTNACKHTEKGEIHLHVSTTENPECLTFSVTDTGEGIPEEMRKDIFERYRKAHSHVQGSGLGLHICSTIAEKLGGEIKLDESYTAGARFLFILPL